MIAAGIGYYYFRPRVKDAVALHRAVVSQKNVALTGILYSEDNPSAIIGGAIVKEGDMIGDVKVVKIRKNIVEFEKNGKKWTQGTQ